MTNYHAQHAVPMVTDAGLSRAEGWPLATLGQVPWQPAQIVQVPEENFDDARKELVKRTFCAGATDLELELFLSTCKRLKLSPEARQIFSVARWDSEQRRQVRQTQVSIDGLRLIAERTGRYQGQTEPQWCGPDGVWKDLWTGEGAPFAARIGVYKQGFVAPLFRTAKFTSFAQTTKDGSPNRMWRTMGEHMLSKVAEALALRAAFPNETSGAYIPEEMQQAENDAPHEERRPQPEPERKALPPRAETQEPPRTQPTPNRESAKSNDKPDEDDSPLLGLKRKDADKRMSTLSDDDCAAYVRSLFHARDSMIESLQKIDEDKEPGRVKKIKGGIHTMEEEFIPPRVAYAEKVRKLNWRKDNSERTKALKNAVSDKKPAVPVDQSVHPDFPNTKVTECTDAQLAKLVMHLESVYVGDDKDQRRAVVEMVFSNRQQETLGAQV